MLYRANAITHNQQFDCFSQHHKPLPGTNLESYEIRIYKNNIHNEDL
jgi:hypothetical protein